MPTTAFSTYFRRELDAPQLLALARQQEVAEPRADDVISGELRAWLRDDVKCSSCGAGGAQIVRSATAASGKVLRQPHFRFVADGGGDAHHRFCEFYGDDTPGGVRPDTLVDFGSTRSAETREIRELVCKGISLGLFDQVAIRAMRQWFFDLKVANRFTVSAAPEVFAWMAALRRHYSWLKWDFDPSLGDLPGFEWVEAAKWAFEQQNAEMLERVRAVPAAVITRARDLAARNAGRDVFDAQALEPYYQASVALAAFLVVHGGYFRAKYRPAEFRFLGAPAPLLAFCALLLSMNNWDKTAAVATFVKVLAAPAPSDLTLGNVMGLNPFHDYAAWRAVKIAGEISADQRGGFDYAQQMAAIEADLRERHRQWRAGRPD